MKIAEYRKRANLAQLSIGLLLAMFLLTTSCSEELPKSSFEPKTKDQKLAPALETKDPIPIPKEHYFYADALRNPQHKKIDAKIDYVHYPTLGCPALLGPKKMLQVLLSLPDGAKENKVEFKLTDRHRGGGTYGLQTVGDPEVIFPLEKSPGMVEKFPEMVKKFPEMKKCEPRELVRYHLKMDNAPFALFDLHVTFHDKGEVKERVQHNAVRRYQSITGREQVIFCGDSQYYVHNQECLKKFIDKVNQLKVAWIALIGDVCDNGGAGARLGTHAVGEWVDFNTEFVEHYYEREYPKAHELLKDLKHPVIIVPGNHDGMSAYKNYGKYDEMKPTDTVTGFDRQYMDVEYDGLQHFQRTFGPLYFSFDWDKTRYFCLNSFDLPRYQRLGYHFIVANWGGWMGADQMRWLKEEMKNANGKGKVILMHHDPRGGSEGEKLGHYHTFRPYRYNRRRDIAKDYSLYTLTHGLGLFQQEWMKLDSKLDNHPVQKLLRTMLNEKVWGVVMGHDNDNWIESYEKGGNLLRPSTRYPKETFLVTVDDMLSGEFQKLSKPLKKLQDTVEDCLRRENYQKLSELLKTMDKKEAKAALRAGLQKYLKRPSHAKRRVAASERRVAASENQAKIWKLEINSKLYFLHVDDVGSYKYSRNKDFEDYGYVLATLDGGAPVQVEGHRIGHIGHTDFFLKLEKD